MATDLNICKPNIVAKTTGHFGTTGKLYSFGLHGSYRDVEHITLANYVHKKRKTYDTKSMSKEYELMCISGLQNGLKTISKQIPNIRKLIAPCCDFLGKLIYGFLGINKRDDTYPFLSVHCNIDINVAEYHTEEDIRYTHLFYPWQKNDKDTRENLSFKFQINEMELEFCAYAGLTIIYSALLLTHHQSLKQVGNNLINFSAYTNKKIYSHSRLSLEHGKKVSIVKIKNKKDHTNIKHVI